MAATKPAGPHRPSGLSNFSGSASGPVRGASRRSQADRARPQVGPPSRFGPVERTKPEGMRWASSASRRPCSCRDGERQCRFSAALMGLPIVVTIILVPLVMSIVLPATTIDAYPIRGSPFHPIPLRSKRERRSCPQRKRCRQCRWRITGVATRSTTGTHPGSSPRPCCRGG